MYLTHRRKSYRSQEEVDPLAPGLTIASRTTDTITLTVVDNNPANDGDHGIRLFYSLNGTDYEFQADTFAGEYPASGLNNNTLYWFKGIEYPVEEGYNYGNIIATQTLIPDPTDLGGTSNSPVSNSLTWDSHSALNTYGVIVETSLDNSDWDVLTTLDPGTTTYELTTTPGVNVYIRVKLLSSYGDSAYSNHYFVEVSDGIPAAPTGPSTSNPTASSLDLNWTDNSSGQTQETAFVIQKSTNNTDWSSSMSAGADATTITVDSLSPETLWYLRIRAENSYGNSSWVSTSGYTKLAAPTPFNASPQSPTSTTLSWSSDSTVEESFTIERSPDGIDYTGEATKDPNTGTHSISTSASENVYVRIKANSATYGDSDWAYTSFTAPDGIPAAPSAAYTLNPTSNSLDLYWTDNANDPNQENEFRLEMSTGGGGFSPIAYPAANSSSYFVTGLSPEMSYDFRIYAVSSYGESSYTTAYGSTTA